VFQKIMIMSSAKTKGMEKVNIVKLQNTRRDFESMQMKETEDINSFIN